MIKGDKVRCIKEHIDKANPNQSLGVLNEIYTINHSFASSNFMTLTELIWNDKPQESILVNKNRFEKIENNS